MRTELFVGKERWSALLFICVLLASLFPLWGTAHNLSLRNDDTYITLTYAKSLASGEGWRYNGGAETLGTTTPLFALSVALLVRLLPFFSPELVAVALSTACWLGMGWLVFLAHRTFGLKQGEAFLLALLLLFAGWWLPTLGMEASALAFGLLASTWLTARGSAFAAGLLSALLFLIRPEGLAMVPVAALALLLHHREQWRSKLLPFIVGALLPLGLWSVYSWAKFGGILPNSAVAKMGQGAGWPGPSFIEQLLRTWLPGYASHYGPSPALSLLWPLALLGLAYACRTARPLLQLLMWVFIFLAVYGLLRAPGYWWYMMPVLLTLHLLAGLGLLFLLSYRHRLVRGVGLTLAILFLALTFQKGVEAVLESEGDPRAPTYLAVAGWLRENTPPGSSVAYVEIGYLGYFTDNHIVDLVGLTRPEFVENARELDLAQNFWLAQPDYLLYSDTLTWLIGDLVQEERFVQAYEEIARFPGPGEGAEMILFQRVRPSGGS